MSLFPGVDKEIKELNKQKLERIEKWIKNQETFTPSNGIESMMFDGVCKGCNMYDYENPKCKIEVEFWSGIPKKEIIKVRENVLCIKHSSIKIENEVNLKENRRC